MPDNKNILSKGYELISPHYTYRIERVLGKGGFGITYLASANIKVGNVTLKAMFAIKEHFMTSDCERNPGSSQVVYSQPARERVENSRKDFMAEAARLQKVGTRHKNIVKVNEVFEANNTAYYVMEYLEGQSLRDYVKAKGTLHETEMLELLEPIFDAVRFLHSNRMTHLDIKPENIMIVTDADGAVRPVLIDFGLSKHYDKDGRPTSTVNVLGCSDGYAPIEQYAGITNFIPEADIYALGATMAFCLTGSDPAKSTDLREGELAKSLPETVSQPVRDMIAGATALSRYERKLKRPLPPAEANAGTNSLHIDSQPGNGGFNPNSTTILSTANKTTISKNTSLLCSPLANQSTPTKNKGKKPLILIAALTALLVVVITTIIFWPKATSHSADDDEHSDALTDSTSQADDDDIDIEQLVNDTREGSIRNQRVNEYVGQFGHYPPITPAEMYAKGYAAVEASNSSEAWYWMLLAATYEYGQAENYCGSMYYNNHIDENDEYVGDSKGNRKNHIQIAFNFYERAAFHNIGFSQIMLAEAYEFGNEAIAQDTDQAIYWYKEAKKNGFSRWASDALERLGVAVDS